MIQLISIAVIALFLLARNDAFAPSHSITASKGIPLSGDIIERSSKRSSHLDDDVDVVEMTNNNMKKFLMCTATAFAFAVTPVLSVSASTAYSDIDRLPTIQIADNVKELDFSLPSYEDIKSYKASAENAKSLTVQPKPFDPKSISLRTSSSTSDATSNEELTATTASDDRTTSSSNPLGSILPSLSKKGPKQKVSYDGYTF